MIGQRYELEECKMKDEKQCTIKGTEEVVDEKKRSKEKRWSWSEGEFIKRKMKIEGRYKVLALLAAPLAPQLRFKPLKKLIAFAIEIKGAALCN